MEYMSNNRNWYATSRMELEWNHHCISQVYTEAFTCPCVRYHPHEASFVAQSNGNYIAIFSARPPFKLNKYMRFEGHGVWGFPVKCSFSLSGRELASGSSDGSMYFYDYKSARLLRKIEAFKEACTDVVYHPVMPNVIAACSWTGEISVFEWHNIMLGTEVMLSVRWQTLYAPVISLGTIGVDPTETLSALGKIME